MSSDVPFAFGREGGLYAHVSFMPAFPLVTGVKFLAIVVILPVSNSVDQLVPPSDNPTQRIPRTIEPSVGVQMGKLRVNTCTDGALQCLSELSLWACMHTLIKSVTVIIVG
jgi:hypothetical protein